MAKQNPYLDHNFNDVTNEVEEMQTRLLADIKADPHYYAELVADLYFHWKRGTYETPLMVHFHNGTK